MDLECWTAAGRGKWGEGCETENGGRQNWKIRLRPGLTAKTEEDGDGATLRWDESPRPGFQTRPGCSGKWNWKAAKVVKLVEE